jgi:PAS domain S-box-containing protein
VEGRAMNRFPGIGRFVAAVAVAALMSCPAVAAAYTRRTILVLHSYHKAQWTDSLLSGMMPVLDRQPGVDVVVEYMDTKRLDTPEYLELLRRLLALKYGGSVFDAVITSDNNALSFVIDNRRELFAGVPVIFCGVNDFTPAMLRGDTNVTGVVEEADFDETLEVAFRLRPKVSTVYGICDRTATGLINRKAFLEAVNRLRPGMKVTMIEDVTIDDLGLTLASLPPDEIVFFISFWQDRTGRSVTPQELGLHFRRSGAPVFSRSEWMIGGGTVGGKCVSGESQGRVAAEMAVRVLRGEPASAIPVLTRSPNLFMFDYPELARFGIGLELLPEGSLIHDQPAAFYAVSKPVMGVLLGSLVVFGVLAALLAASIRLRRRAIESLRRSEENLRITLRSIGDGVITADRDGTVTAMNPVAEALTGWPAEDAVGKPISQVFEVINEFSREKIENPVAAVLRSGKAFTLADNTLLVGRDRSERRVADSGAPIRTAAGELVGVVLVFRDVTEKSGLEEQLRHAQKMDAIGRLAGGVAHDFNNLLAGILGSAEVLERMLKDRRDTEPFVRLIVDTSHRAGALTSKLLNLSRQGRREPARIDVNALVEDVAQILRSSIDRRIEVRTRCEAARAFILGDPTEIQSIVLNLGVNARDAMPMGGSMLLATRDRTVDETLAAMQGIAPGRYCEILVEDSGLGMDASMLERIFEPFFTTKGFGSGTGLGLSIAYSSVREHRGAILVESELERGTIFRVLLPEVEAPEARANRDAGDDAPCGHGDEYVLLVDDEEIIRTTTSSLLESTGCRVLTAASGREALERVEQHRGKLKLVILDMVMPGLDGRETLKALQKLAPDLPVIISSGYSRGAEVDDLLRLGARGFIMKPYRHKDLVELLRSTLNGSHGQAPTPDTGR